MAQDAAVPHVDLHGFVSQGFIYTTDNQYLAQSEDGSFEFSEVGLNFTTTLTPELRLGIQLFARDLGPLGNYEPKFDWYYLDYRFFDWLGLRAGRTKIPGGLYNETSDIDAARVPILLPQSIYPAWGREFLLAQTGAELYGYVPLAAAGALDYRLYGGTLNYDPPVREPDVEYSARFIAGGRLQWFTPLPGLSAAFSAVTLRLQQDATLAAEDAAALQEAGLLSPGFAGQVEVELPISIWTASLEYTIGNLLVAAEYSRSYTGFDTSEPGLNLVLFPPDGEPPKPRGESYYAMIWYRVTTWFTPGIYYARSRPDTSIDRGRARHQRDWALFVRFDLNPYWLFKLEAHYMNGTAGLDPDLNGLASKEELNDLTRDWGAFLAKTTVYF